MPSIWHSDRLHGRRSDLRQLRRRVAREREDLVYVDIVSAMLKDGAPDASLYIADGLHMKSAGYNLWRERLMRAFRHAKASKAPGC